MARTGRPSMPTVEKAARGTARKRTDRIDGMGGGEEPRPVAAILPPPEHLSPRAQAEWRRLVRELSALGLFTPLDPTALEAHCVAYDIAARAVEELQAGAAATEEGHEDEGKEDATGGRLIIDLPNGFQQANPLLDVIAKFYKLAGEFGTKFGLDPAARSTKVRTTKKQDGAGNRVAAHRDRAKRQRSA